MTSSDPGSHHRSRAWYRDPLLQYLTVGVVLAVGFVLFDGDDDAAADARRIEIGATELQWLHRNWQARRQRPPTETELRGLVDDYVRQEVLYRTGAAMGLDRGDEVIRRRVQQKLELLTEDVAALTQPTEAELQTYLTEHAADYAIAERRSFTQIYFNLDERGRKGVAAAEALLADLRGQPAATVHADELGDRFMLGTRFESASPFAVNREFGSRFSESLFALEPGGWEGPVYSGFGLHLVRIDAVVPGRAPALAEVRDEVLRDHQVASRERARDEIYAALAREYDITIDEEALRALPVTAAPAGDDR